MHETQDRFQMLVSCGGGKTVVALTINQGYLLQDG